MAFTPTNLFKSISCPYGEDCNLGNCIFRHDEKSLVGQDSKPVLNASREVNSTEPPTKRRKVTSDVDHMQPFPQLKSFTRSISPPSTTINDDMDEMSPYGRGRGLDYDAPAPSNNAMLDYDDPPALPETLNPRMVPNDAAGFKKRVVMLKFLHGEMSRAGKDAMTQQDLIKMALDEEEKIIREQPLLYTNIIKQRIAAYKKMTPSQFAERVQSTRQNATGAPPAKRAKRESESALTMEEEISMLPYLVEENQSRLATFGYIPSPPTFEDANNAAKTVAVSRNWEECARCGSRFQVFPDRNEEGLLASKGPCKYHPERKVYQKHTKGDAAMGAIKKACYPCCNDVEGSEGCTESQYHVFKAPKPARLAAVDPFDTTPENEDPVKDRKGNKVHAVAFDCEMAYTVKGLELIRLTAVTWPAGEKLIDVFVRPIGTIIDLNTRFSGVHPEDLADCIASPQAARELLCSYLTPQTPLIGHGIENDLNAVRLCHPTIIDTVLLYPHSTGLPRRNKLKLLAKDYLNRTIQDGGSEKGHDSLEDAVAAGDLVRLAAAKEFRRLRAPPSPEAESTFDAGAMLDRMASRGKGRKRKRGGNAGSSGEDLEEGEIPQGLAAYLHR